MGDKLVNVKSWTVGCESIYGFTGGSSSRGMFFIVIESLMICCCCQSPFQPGLPELHDCEFATSFSTLAKKCELERVVDEMKCSIKSVMAGVRD